jgi:hypothetical protein
MQIAAHVYPNPQHIHFKSIYMTLSINAAFKAVCANGKPLSETAQPPPPKETA